MDNLKDLLGPVLDDALARAPEADENVAATVQADEEVRLAGFAYKEIERERLPAHMTSEGTDWTRFTAAQVEQVAMASRGDGCVYLSGPTDSGKTHLACVIVRSRAARGKSICRLKEPDFFNLWDVCRYGDGRYFRREVDRAKNAAVLLWEDFGKRQLAEDAEGEKMTPFGQTVFEIMDWRAEHKTPVIFTTQYCNAEALQKVAGRALIRRMMRPPLIGITFTPEEIEKRRAREFLRSKIELEAKQ